MFSLVDVGCDLGDGCILFKEKFPKAEIEGCDFSDIGIKKAKKRNSKIKFFVLDILKEQIPKRYDFITLVSILEHFDNPLPVIDKCIKKTNKALIISCPYNEQHLLGEHRYSFNEKTLKRYSPKITIKNNRIIYLIKKFT